MVHYSPLTFLTMGMCSAICTSCSISMLWQGDQLNAQVLKGDVIGN